MNIKKIVVGVLDTNCYILSKNNEVIIIDPGDEANKIISKIDKDKKVIGIIITHSHFDHIGALDEISSYYNAPIYNYNNLNIGNNKIGSFDFDVIYSPGHLNDLVVIYFKNEKNMFVGDFIFKNSIGRCDLAGGDNLKMKESLKNILKYDDDIKIFPGHGDETTLGNERDNLHYFINVI